MEGNVPERVRRFLALYNQLDALLRARSGCGSDGPSHAKLLDALAARDAVIRGHLSRLHAYRALRNSLVHLQDERVDPIAEPREDVVEDYARIVAYVLRPPRALDSIAIRPPEIFCVSWDTPIRLALRTMIPRAWRIAPVVESGRLEGVFLEDALTRAFHDDGELSLSGEATFDRLRRHCTFAERATIPGVFLTKPELTIEDVERMFQANFAAGVATGAVLVTPNACPGDALLGLITAHDLPSASGRPRLALP